MKIITQKPAIWFQALRCSVEPLIHELGIGRAALVAILYLTVEFILGNMVEPMLMGRKLGLSTVVVIVFLIFWGNVLGIVGVFLCIPLTMTLKFVCENNKNTRWIAILLGPEMTPEKAPPASIKGDDRVT